MPEGKQSSRLETLMPALIGLGGVLVGVLVTAGVTYLGDRSRRIADERSARFLIQQEILGDTNILLHFSEYGVSGGSAPTVIEWQSESPTLARYISQSKWNTVSKFYTNMLNNQPSLTKQCPTELTKAQKAIAVDARNEIRTDVLLGANAYYALSKTEIPLNVKARLLTEACPTTTGR
jgi:hypothetical protein